MTPRQASCEASAQQPLTGRALLFVFVVVSVNGLTSVVAPFLWLAGGVTVDAVLRRNIAVTWAVVSLFVQLAALAITVGHRVMELRSLRRIRRRIEHVLQAGPIMIAFQPIVNHKLESIIGVEALARFPATQHRSPDQWFAAAERVGLGVELELHAIRSGLACTEALPANVYISLNVSPATLADERLMPVILASGVPLDRIVLEITEHCSVPDYSVLSRVRSDLAERSVRLCVDDAGSGFASFRHIVTLSPNVIKLDKALVRGIDQDEALQALVRAIVGFAAAIGASVVGEGVETLEELRALGAAGVDVVQGFYIEEPSVDPVRWSRWVHPIRLGERGGHTVDRDCVTVTSGRRPRSYPTGPLRLEAGLER